MGDNILIPHSKPFVGEEEAQAVFNIITSRQLAAGKKAKAVEKKWSAITASGDSAMVSSGLSALRLALKALDIDKFSSVIIPGYCCVAIINSILALGAKPVLADIKSDLTIRPRDVKRKLTKKTKAIVAVHTFGQHADIESLRELEIPIIEDMAHGIFKQEADLAISSFYPTKLIAGCGGGVVSGHKDLIVKIKDLREYGDKKPSLRQNDMPNDVSAAIVLEQLKKYEDTILARWWNAGYYKRLLEDLKTNKYKYRHSIILPIWKQMGKYRIWYRYVIRLKKHNAAEVSEKMKAKGIMAEQPVWDYRHTINWTSNLSNTDIAFDACLSLPLYPDITEKEQNRVINTLEEILDIPVMIIANGFQLRNFRR